MLRRLPSVRLLLAALCSLTLLCAASLAEAKQRHALVVGVGAYKDASGLSRLTAPVNDAELLKLALEAGGVDFAVEILKDDEVADKAAFEAALRRFLARVRPGDEVLFYFSGHGYHVPGQGNFFLLQDAKSQPVYIKDLGAAAGRELDTQDRRDRRYREWIAEVAISEDAVEKAIEATRAEVVIIIADACRNLIGGAKGASIVASGVGLPRDISRGTYRLYSASPGQVSLDNPDRGSAARALPGRQYRSEARDRRDSKDDKDGGRRGGEKRETSLFTRVLLQELQVPRLEINILFSKVKIEVREQARKLGVEQIPDFYDSRDATLYYFRGGGGAGEMEARCFNARNELANLRYGVAAGSVGRDQLEAKKADLAPCGQEFVTEVEKLLRFESQGAGALSTSELAKFVDASTITDPIQLCDVLGSSPLDPSRPQGIAGFDVQKLALEALKSEQLRASATERLRAVISGCEAAVQARPRVARYKFNLARTHYSLATLTDQKIDREDSLVQASRFNQEAVDQGYVAAFNNLAIMHQNGEFYEQTPRGYERRPPDRKKAFDYFKRGADLNHAVAQHNLGMAYKNGELGAEVASVGSAASTDSAQPTSRTREALARQHLSRAAEAGYVPAMVESAKLQPWQSDTGARQRAVELLEVASSRGSWEAMAQLGWVHEYSGAVQCVVCGNQREASVNYADAIVWYSRAAEAGDTGAQTRLAMMLLDGEGLPAPQPDAAARYLRLASAAGNIQAQMLLAGRLRDRKVMFRPRLDGKADGGALEVIHLYYSAFARGNSQAGLELARLFRTGFPPEKPSDAIPRSAQAAAKLLWDTIDKVRNSDPSSANANPQTEVFAAVELIKMHEAGEARGVGGPDAITDDQIDNLKLDYGDVSRLKYVRTSAVGSINCRGKEFWAMIWDGRSVMQSLETQFDWFELNNRCKELTQVEREQREQDTRAKRTVIKESELGIPKKTREAFKREYDAALKDKDKKRSFVDRMVDLVSTDTKKKK